MLAASISHTTKTGQPSLFLQEARDGGHGKEVRGVVLEGLMAAACREGERRRDGETE